MCIRDSGEAVYDMVFEALKQKKRSGDLVPRKFSCFTYEDNDLVVNQQYTISVSYTHLDVYKRQISIFITFH